MSRLIKLLIVVSAIIFADGSTISWGSLRDRDLILFDQFFHEPREESTIVARNFLFTSQHGELITAIHVTDLTNVQNGGTVRILCGGIGYTFVKLQLMSECSQQVLLNIEIYGAS